MIGGVSEINLVLMLSKIFGLGVFLLMYENGINGIFRGIDIFSVIFLYSLKVIGDGGSGSGVGFLIFVYM